MIFITILSFQSCFQSPIFQQTHFPFLQQFEGFCMNRIPDTAASLVPRLTAETKFGQAEETVLSRSVLQRFISYMARFRNNHLREGVKNIYGRHYAVKNIPQYQFKEQWERNRRMDFEQNNYYEIIQSEAVIAYFYTTIFLVFQVFLIWFYSTFRLLGLVQWDIAQLILGGSTAATCLDVALKFYLKYIKTGALIQVLEVLVTFWESIVLLIYYILNWMLVSLRIYSQKSQFYILDIIAICLLIRRAKGLYQHFKIRSYTTPYKSYFKIFDLLSNIIAIEHFFALLIYLVSFYDSDRNWLMRYGQPEVDQIQRYFYSFYFTSTTIFTIGYGDFVPVNNMEILCVLVMQMLGIAHFSYLINEIGYTLSSLRKEEEELEQNISTLGKMNKYYCIDQDLNNLAKEHLLQNKKKFQDIQLQQENRVLMKLNDELRQTMLYQNRLNIMKSCVFFVCHWTRNLQAEVAKRLIKRILVPNEPALQALGKQRIYIIKSGKLEIYTNNCHGFKRHFKKLLKTIQPKPDKPISDNVYGYSAVISGKQIKLQAVSKDFTCVYYIDRASFMQCVHQNKLDTEYYFEIKAKLDASRQIEGFQAPAILNIRQHYRPSEMFIIKRNTHKLNRYKNKRKDYKRNNRNPLVCTTKILVNNNNCVSQDIPTTSNQIRLTFYDYYHQQTSPGGNRGSSSEDKTLREETSQISRQAIQNMSKQTIVTSRFEVMKEYHKYYKRYNMHFVLDKLEKSNYISKDHVEPIRHYPSEQDHAIHTLKHVAPTKYFTSE